MPDRAVLLEVRRRVSRASEHRPHYTVNAQQRVAIDTITILTGHKATGEMAAPASPIPAEAR